MKKLFAAIMCILLCLPVWGCNKSDNSIRIYMPDGAPALAFAKLMHDHAEIGGEKTEYIVVPPATIKDYVISKKADFAILPTNSAANLYNLGADYSLVSTSTHGNLYIVGYDEIASLSAMKGKVIGVIGQFDTPGLVFSCLLSEAGITSNIYNSPSDIKPDEISIQYFSSGGDMLPLIKQKVINYGLLGEPAVTTAEANIEVKVIFDINELWKAATGFERLPQASLVAKNGKFSAIILNELLGKMRENLEWIEDNPQLARDAIAANMISGSSTSIGSLSAETVKRCNIDVRSGQDTVLEVKDLLGAIFKLDASAVGGKLPDDSFYTVRH